MLLVQVAAELDLRALAERVEEEERQVVQDFGSLCISTICLLSLFLEGNALKQELQELQEVTRGKGTRG
jgi:hypothetical protein